MISRTVGKKYGEEVGQGRAEQKMEAISSQAIKKTSSLDSGLDLALKDICSTQPIAPNTGHCNNYQTWPHLGVIQFQVSPNCYCGQNPEKAAHIL